MGQIKIFLSKIYLFSDIILYSLGMFFAFLSPVKELLYFAGFTIFLDVVTGSLASRKRGEKFDSKKLSRTWAKIILYPLGIIFSHGAEVLIPEIPFIKGASFILICIEGKSFEENVSDIFGYPLMRYISTFIMKGRKGLIEEISAKNNKDEKAV